MILWIPHGDGKLHLIASNAPDADGLVTFPVNADGTLGKPSLHDAGGASPFYLAFLHGRPDTFLIGYAISDAVSMGKIDADGKLSIGPLVKINTSSGVPSELCWLAVSPDDRFVFSILVAIAIPCAWGAWASSARRRGNSGCAPLQICQNLWRPP